MRKIESQSQKTSISLDPFDISSQDFYSHLEDTVPNETSVQLQTGTWSDDSRFALENIQEIGQNIDKLVSPFELNVGGTNLKIDRYDARISHDDEQESEAFALGLKTFLSQHSSIQRKLIKHQVLTGGVIGIVIVALMANPSLTWVEIVVAVALAIIFGGAWSIRLSMKVHPCVVKYRPRDSFWKRNRDTIVVGFIMLVLGLIGREIFSLI